MNEDDIISVCNAMDSEPWEEDILQQPVQEAEPEDEEEGMQIEPPPLSMKVQSFMDDILALEDVQNFCESRGHLIASLHTYIHT